MKKEEICPGPESNRHGGLAYRGILSPLRLPVSPPGHFRNNRAVSAEHLSLKIGRKRERR